MVSLNLVNFSVDKHYECVNSLLLFQERQIKAEKIICKLLIIDRLRMDKRR
jgi:hypothetical protein